MKKLFSIGQTSRINNITIKTLRFYDEKGILKPAYIDENNGYRYYSIDQFLKIDILIYSKHLGIPLKEIKEIFSSSDMNVFIDFLDKQKLRASEEIDALKRIVNDIDTIKDSLNYVNELPLNHDISIKHIDNRYILANTMSSTVTADERILLYKDLYKKVKDNNLRENFTSGYFINVDSFLRDGSFIYEKVFIGLNTNSSCEVISSIPSGNYLCITYNEENRYLCLKNIHKYLLDNTISCKLIIECEYVKDIFNDTDSFFEIQVLL